MDDSFKTITDSAQAELRIQRSRFIANAFPCSKREHAESQIEKIARKYHDATHNCYGYKILSESGQEIFRYSDAGEPPGTAGRQIYDTLGSFGLLNVGLVVTRYFGGIKLGTGGLVRAYRDSARAALEKANIVERMIVKKYRIRFPLNLTNLVLRTLALDGVSIIESTYTTEGNIAFEVRLSKAKSIRDILISKSNAAIEIKKIH